MYHQGKHAPITSRCTCLACVEMIWLGMIIARGLGILGPTFDVCRREPLLKVELDPDHARAIRDYRSSEHGLGPSLCICIAQGIRYRLRLAGKRHG